MADEIGHKTAFGLVVEGIGRIPLLDDAIRHDANLVCHGKGFVLVVRNEQGSNAFMLQDVANFNGEFFSQFHIQVGKRLIHEQQARLWGQCTRQCYALLLATRKFVRIGLGSSGKSNRFQHLLNPCGTCWAIKVAQAKSDVARNGQVREQRIVLKHHANLA